MATNFPSSQDNFTNPTSSDTLDSPDHAAQHTDVNDAVEAIEGALLDGAPLKIDDANERVGIGTTSPSVKVEVADGTNAELRLNDTGGTVGGSLNAKLALKGNGSSAGVLGFNNTASGILTLTNEDGQVYLQTKSNDSLLLRTDSTTRVTVTGTGDVGINDTTPSYKLDVNGDVRTTGAFYINTMKQGEWVSFTPVPLDYGSPAYTSSGSTTHNIGTSNSYYTATLNGYYMLSGNLCTVEYYGAYASGSLTNTPMYSLPFLPEKGGGSNTGMGWYGWGTMTAFMGATYYLRPRITDTTHQTSRKHVNGVVELRQLSGTVSYSNLVNTGSWFPPYGQNANSFNSGHVRLRIQYNIDL